MLTEPWRKRAALVASIYHDLSSHLRRLFPIMPLGRVQGKTPNHASVAAAQSTPREHNIFQLYRVFSVERHSLQRVSYS